MAAAVWSRTTTAGSVGFLHKTFNFVRALSASAASSPSPISAEASEKPKRQKKKNLFEVAQFLPDWGVGYKMAKTHWRDVAYQIIKINLYKDGRHGKAWGIRYKAGMPATETPVKMSGVNKRGWRYIPESRKKPQNEPSNPEAAESTLA